MRRLLFGLLALMLIGGLLPASPALGQDQEPRYWTISSSKIVGARLGECLEAQHKYLTPINQELKTRGLLLDSKTLVHAWGDEWNVVNVSVHDSWADIQGAQDAFGDIRRELYTDEE